ncbi:MAG: tRNA pseudouridine(55) synthase TruB [Pseudomonadota bacterium]|jgi:tRNA pseudouridine55 synthase|nr:tRNA pseudouridine(55) synthase TruB [Pseudomonadota bacterium]MED5254318.1 tRNA pseudouridine(55) synthase TruB [Pseudomonadota bacterium]|tara:strand:+ start:535 stop:1485 length:951 start_codon:yes stop_codon:yes gene_type:complete
MIQSLVKLKSENSYFSSGWIFVNKPKNVSSFDVIRRLKKIFSIKRIGHAGTLDPLATGILPIAFGSATKTIPYLVSSKKEYRFSISWGIRTTTHDMEGEVIDESNFVPSKEDILDAVSDFKGEFYQRPPKYSAVKINGQRAYKLARSGIDFNIKEKKVKLYELIIKDHKKNKTEFLAKVGKGFYIRSLARDLCEKLATSGVIDSLERTELGQFSLENAFSLETIEKLVHSAPAGMVGGNLLVPLSEVLDDIPALLISDKEAKRFQQGQSFSNNDLLKYSKLGREVLLLKDNRPIGLATVVENSFKPKKVFSEEIFN